MAGISYEACAHILDNLPQVVMRLVYDDPNWNVLYVNNAIEQYGYGKDEFAPGKITWNELLHPDDRVVALKLAHDYLKNNIDDFKLQYRVQTKKGASIYITEYSHVNRQPNGSVESIDSFLFENLEVQSSNNPNSDAVIRRNLALKDILLTLQDASAEPEKAIQFILDRAGALLDCSRALLFKDSPDHKTCKVVYEWLNHGISSIMGLDYAVTYATEMPEIYVALQKTGVLLVNAGEIPENCKEEFEAEGLISSAIFAVYQHGDHYGFVCFDDCIIERKWDDDTANFLKVLANLLSTAVMHLQGEQYLQDYEDKIKGLAFRDYPTGLPNRYPFDSDLADIILSDHAGGAPGYAIMIAMNNMDSVRNRHGLVVANNVGKEIVAGLQGIMREALGESATLYRIAGTAFAVLLPSGSAEAVKTFANRASERSKSPWIVDGGEFACVLNVSVLPLGIKNTDPEKIFARLDAGLVESSSEPGNPPVFLSDEG